MKHIKTFELNQNEPKVGDYVLCKELYFDTEGLENFITNNIGRIVGIDSNNYKIPFDVKYEDVPNDIKQNFGFIVKNDRIMRREEIIYFSPNKEELEAILQANKYNI